MDWSNDTIILAGRDPEVTALDWRELLFRHGYDAVENIFLYVLPFLSNLSFIVYTIYHSARVTPQKSSDPIEPQKKMLSVRIAAFELSFLAAQAIITGLDMKGLAPVNNLMGFVAAVTGYFIFNRETNGHPLSKSTYLFVLLWILIDISKLSGYLSHGNTRVLALGGYVTGYYRSELLTVMLMPTVLPGPDHLTLVHQLDAHYGRRMPQSKPGPASEAASKDALQEASEKASEEEIEDILKLWKNTGECPVPAPRKSQKKKKKHTRNARHKTR